MESPEFLWRVDYFRKVPAVVRFVSAEPLLGLLQGINLDGIHWLIGGGESQAGARPAKLQWFRDLRIACIKDSRPSRRGTAMALEKELATYNANLPELKAQAGKYVLIHGEDVTDTYSAYDDALKEGYEKCGLEPFLVKRIEAVEQAHFISRFVAPTTHTA